MLKIFHQRIGNKSTVDLEAFDARSLQKKIGYSFKNKSLLIHAFKHRSYLSLTHEASYESNERLEFLGDAVLDLIVTEDLYYKHPTTNEGVLSQWKSVLVSRQVLSKLVHEIGLGAYLLIDKGEEKTGGRKRFSNLANLFEAVLGAVYLDGGYKAAKKFTYKFLLSRQEELLEIKSFFNYKSALLEYTQGKGWGAPRYRVVKESGPDHAKQFIVEVYLGKRFLAEGSGKSKKKAEQEAARNALQKVENIQNNK